MQSDQQARGGVKLLGEEFFVIIWDYMDFILQGVKLFVILMLISCLTLKQQHLQQ